MSPVPLTKEKAARIAEELARVAEEEKEERELIENAENCLKNFKDLTNSKKKLNAARDEINEADLHLRIRILRNTSGPRSYSFPNEIKINELHTPIKG